MITEKKTDLLSKISWDYDYSDKELLSLINDKGNLKPDRLSLYIKSLETFTWQELVSLWGLEECNSLYTDKIRKGIFSNKLREQYDGIFNLLRNKTLSYTERSPENLKSLNLPFYLTGGTALSRGYFNHRYSDDLDFFVNNDKDFFKHTESFIDTLKQNGFAVEVQPTTSDSFTRIFVNKNTNGLDKNGLKIDFVNDIDAHFGTIKETPVFYRTDSILTGMI